ncbi:MAG: FAD-dependent oxidoreductase, partial [Opitutales bacterium]
MMAILVLGFLPLGKLAGEEDAGPGLESLRHVRDLVRQSQLDDGAIRMQASGTNVRIVPYFSNLAAHGLLLAHRIDPHAEDLDRVRNWILWYAANQEPDGTMYDFTGTLEAVTKSDQRDSTDSYAATFLQVLAEFAAIAGPEAVTAEMVGAGIGALDAIELTFDSADGLTWAMPEYLQKFLMDNLEVKDGLEEAGPFFDAVGEPVEAARARQILAGVEEGLEEFWLPEEGYYAWAKGSSGALHQGFELWYPDALVNLFALAYAEPVRPELWEALTETFGDDPDLTPEWWVFPALRVGTAEERRRHVIATMDFARSMTAQSHQVNRTGRTLLALAASAAVWQGLEPVVIVASAQDRVILDNDGDGAGDQLGAVSQPTAAVGEPFLDARQSRYYLPFELTTTERDRIAGESGGEVFLRLRLDGRNAVDGLVVRLFGYNDRTALNAITGDYNEADLTLLEPSAITEAAVTGRWLRFDVTEFARAQAGQNQHLLAFRLEIDPPDALPNSDERTNFFRFNSVDSDFVPHLEVVPPVITDPDPDPDDCIQPDATHEFDVVVYGGTASGVMAAVAAAREGASVALLEPFQNLGGMVSGGLGATDHGRVSTIGGLTREFFERLGAKYGQSGVTWRHEPHVAEEVFAEMAAEAGVAVYFDHRLEEVCGVFKTEASIAAIALENGNVFAADVFIDATYEGDLMAQAGVPYRVGREGQAEYGETKAGIRPEFSIDPNFFPYDDEGDLLPTLVEEDAGEEGA